MLLNYCTLIYQTFTQLICFTLQCTDAAMELNGISMPSSAAVALEATSPLRETKQRASNSAAKEGEKQELHESHSVDAEFVEHLS